MKLFRHVGLGGRLLTILAVVLIVDFMVNTVVFDRAGDFMLREDDAARMAEHLVVAHRVLDRTPAAARAAAAAELSTARFRISWSSARSSPANAIELATLRDQILVFEPGLAAADLRLDLMPLTNGGHVVGATRLGDGSHVVFSSLGKSAWSLNLGRLAALAIPSIVLMLLAWFLLRATLAPLRTLVRAASRVGSSDPRPIEEVGQEEIRRLIRAFNTMQDRIHSLLASGSQTMLAIGHDLRTPLARMQLRIDGAPIDAELRRELDHDIDEMRGLLQSLQSFVESGDDHAPRERIDIAATAQTQVDNASDRGAIVSYHGPEHLEIMARPVAIRRALSNLVENALAYAGAARVELREEDGVVEISVDDDGPGIPEDRMAEALRPFIRLDSARGRDTAGMGLGLPIVERAVRSEGGELTLANKPEGGLRVTIRLPQALA